MSESYCINQGLSQHSGGYSDGAVMQPLEHGMTTQAATPNMKLLVVDDDPVMRMIWDAMSDDWGLPVDLSLAVDGSHALLNVISDCPDLIITDLEMPNTDGRALIKYLSTNSLYAHIPIVVMSGSPANDLIMEPAVIAYLAKPFHFEEIRQLLKEQIQKPWNR